MVDLKNVIGNLPSAVIVIDSGHRIIMANKMARRYSGCHEADLIGRSGGDFLDCIHAVKSPSGCGAAKPCRHCRANGAIVRAFRDKTDIDAFETSMETGKRGALILKFTVTLLRCGCDTHGREPASAVMVTVDDMTAYRRREGLTVAMETAGAVCHEMNQPLMVVSGQLDLLALEMGETKRIRALRQQVARMGRATRKLHEIKACSAKPWPANGALVRDEAISCR